MPSTDNHPDISVKILIVDDDEIMLRSLGEVFADQYQVVLASSGARAIELAKNDSELACVVMDIKMPEIDGITAAREIRKLNHDLPVIFFTGYSGQFTEGEIDQREKPFDFLTKGQSVTSLLRSVRNAVETYQLRRDNRRTAIHGEQRYGLVGRSQAMQQVYAMIRKASNSLARVMILGETGTGKELVARAIHAHSARCDRRFGILNCNHKSPDLIEDELFGHVRGAFTNAFRDRVGLFQYADGGTVFLDEIGDLDITTQAKLLRALETGEYQRLGENNYEKTDIRLLCATHRNLDQLVIEGKFREDLFYRLKGIVITLPPLRTRKEDIPMLVDSFRDRFAAGSDSPPKHFDQSAINVMIEYDWPGNVRQLLNVVEAAIVLTSSDLIMAEDLAPHLALTESQVTESERRLSVRLRNLERTLIVEALNECQYNVSAAAAMLGIDPSNLHRKIHLYEISITSLRN